jgi:uncharacterized membrane protein YtjA (UPF0391 family)
MLRSTATFFGLAVIAATVAFGGFAAGAEWIARLLFFGFLVLAAAALIMHLARSWPRTRTAKASHP